MTIHLPRKRIRKRKCKHCKELYLPDARNHHQRYCSKVECRKASKKASQQRWASSEKGYDYFSNSDNMERVKEWRKTHPGYWKRDVPKSQNALQDISTVQPQLNQLDTAKLTTPTLLDLCSLQVPLLIGVIASLTGNTLQDNILETSKKYIDLGQDILGINPVSKT